MLYCPWLDSLGYDTSGEWRSFLLWPWAKLSELSLTLFSVSYFLWSFALKDYHDKRYARCSWGPQLISGTSGKSQGNSRVIWDTFLSYVEIATMNFHFI